jgi:probable rRNA maturation factor
MPTVAIARDASGWRAIARLDGLVRRAALAALAGDGADLRDDVEISILLADDETVRDLNAQWRGKDKPTNVLSFPAASPDLLHEARTLGDVVLACETVFAEAMRENKTPADHLTHLVVHGVLHLLGHDHETEDEAEEMEALERAVLATLGVADPYAIDAAAEA